VLKPTVNDHLQDIHDFAQFHPKATNDFDLHDDDDMFDVPPCKRQNLFCN